MYVYIYIYICDIYIYTYIYRDRERQTLISALTSATKIYTPPPIGVYSV